MLAIISINYICSNDYGEDKILDLSSIQNGKNTRLLNGLTIGES